MKMLFSRLGWFIHLHDCSRQKSYRWISHSSHFDGFGGFCITDSIPILAFPSLEQSSWVFSLLDRLENRWNKATLGSHFTFGRRICRQRCLYQIRTLKMVGSQVYGFGWITSMVDQYHCLCPYRGFNSG